MAFPTTEQQLRRAEGALGFKLPASHRARLLRDNGGEVEVAGEVWELFPVQDDSDRKHLSRTASHILRETSQAKTWPGFPDEAVAIAANGGGDYLILRPAPDAPGTLGNTVYFWEHEGGTITPVNVDWTPRAGGAA